MWSVWVGGQERRLDSLTLDQVARLESEAGASIRTLDPLGKVAHAKAVVRALEVDAAEVTLSDIRRSEDNLPSYFDDGVPRGGRPGDGFIVALVRRGFTPRQIRTEFTLRDLELLAYSQGPDA